MYRQSCKIFYEMFFLRARAESLWRAPQFYTLKKKKRKEEVSWTLSETPFPIERGCRGRLFFVFIYPSLFFFSHLVYPIRDPLLDTGNAVHENLDLFYEKMDKKKKKKDRFLFLLGGFENLLSELLSPMALSSGQQRSIACLLAVPLSIQPILSSSSSYNGKDFVQCSGFFFEVWSDPTSSFFLLRRGALTRILNRRGTAFWSIEQEEEKRKTTKSHDHQDTHSDSIFWEPIFWKLPFWGAYALHTEDWIAWITNFIYCVTITSYW